MSLVDALRKTLSIGNGGESGSHATMPLNFLRTRKSILRELSMSQETGNLIGVYSRAFGEGMFLVSVNSIEIDRSGEVVVFETYDQSGMILNRTRVSIDEIKMVCPFHRKYVNPVLNRVQLA
jgi:hypothetical protein